MMASEHWAAGNSVVSMQSGGRCSKQRMSLTWSQCAGGGLCEALQELTIELVHEQHLDGGALAALTALRALSVSGDPGHGSEPGANREVRASHGMDLHRQHQERSREHVQHVTIGRAHVDA